LIPQVAWNASAANTRKWPRSKRPQGSQASAAAEALFFETQLLATSH
jgi:hypothetical protein